MTNPKVLCIYHGNCDDGFAAAYYVRQALGEHNVEFYPGVYQQAPPSVSGRNVLLVDFSYKRPVLETMIAECRSLLVLDHHKTAQEDLAFMTPVPGYWDTFFRAIEKGELKEAALFDMKRCGTGLVWDYFNAGKPRPHFVEYIEDRDLWKKELVGGDEFSIALRSYPQEFHVWDKFTDNEGVRDLIGEGHSIQRYYRLRVEELKRSAYRGYLETPHGVHHGCCMIANAPYFAASEVAGELAEMPGVDFGASYFEIAPHIWQYSLRSRGDFDVSKIAKAFGGGGHKNAAGFTVSETVAHVPAF